MNILNFTYSSSTPTPDGNLNYNDLLDATEKGYHSSVKFSLYAIKKSYHSLVIFSLYASESKVIDVSNFSKKQERGKIRRLWNKRLHTFSYEIPELQCV